MDRCCTFYLPSPLYPPFPPSRTSGLHCPMFGHRHLFFTSVFWGTWAKRVITTVVGTYQDTLPTLNWATRKTLALQWGAWPCLLETALNRELERFLHLVSPLGCLLLRATRHDLTTWLRTRMQSGLWGLRTWGPHPPLLRECSSLVSQGSFCSPLR